MTKFNLEKCKSSNKGITLIALVITIIVLLILAGVTIAALTGTDSAPVKANEAKQKQDIGAAKDQVYLSASSAQAGAYEEYYVKDATTTAGDASTNVGTFVRTEIYNEYKATNNKKVGLASIVATEDGEITISTTDFKVTGEIAQKGGGLTWGEIETIGGTTPTGGGQQSTSNLSSAEKTALAQNGMTELTTEQIEADTGLTDDQKTALKDSSKVKAVLTGNVPVPVGYDYVEGTTTAITKPTGGSYGVVVEDTNENQWVWVPVNGTESVAPSAIYSNVDGISVGENKKQDNDNKIKLELAKNINGLKIASINDLPSLKVADSSSSSEESEPVTSVTTTKKGASNIISGYTRGDPNDTSSYREPALVSSYDGSYYSQAGFDDLDDMATKMVADYEAMITSIAKYGGFYVGRYELSGTNNGSSSEITNAKVQAGQAPMDSVNWYRLYQACRTFGTGATTSTMIWGTQWDVVCNWSQKVGDQESYSSYQSNRHSGDYDAKTGSNTNDIRNNVCDLEGSRYEWTQEASSTFYRVSRGGFYDDGNGASYGSNYDPNHFSSSDGSRPTLYIK